MKVLYDVRYRFAAGYDPETGRYYRTNMRNILGEDSGRDPFMASFPHMLEIGVTGSCAGGMGELHLKSGPRYASEGEVGREEHMALEDFAGLVQQCAGRTFQFALGGSGDPDQHEYFPEMLRLCRDSEISANVATSGCGLDEDTAAICAEYCGTVSVRWQESESVSRAVNLLLRAGAKTNISFLLSAASIDAAIQLLRNEDLPPGVNRIVFLLHKPIGTDDEDNVLRLSDPRVHEFFSLFNEEPYRALSGFDSCSVPALLNLAPGVDPTTLEACEGARFSAHVTPSLQLLPCPFDVRGQWSADLRRYSVEEAWDGEQFRDFRARLQEQCPECPRREHCLGGCPLHRGIVLCPDVANAAEA